MATKKSAKQKVTFSILAPAARSVQLVGDFSGWEQHPVDLKKLKNGEWTPTHSVRKTASLSSRDRACSRSSSVGCE